MGLFTQHVGPWSCLIWRTLNLVRRFSFSNGVGNEMDEAKVEDICIFNLGQALCKCKVSLFSKPAEVRE